MQVPVPTTVRLSVALVVLVSVAWEAGLAQAPQRGGTPATDAVQQSNDRVHPGWLRGIQIGSLDDGRVTIFVPPHQTGDRDGATGEGIAIDPAGHLYTAESILRGVTKYVRD